MKREQRGMTLISFIIVLGVVGAFIYVAMKLIPMYSEYYSVKRAMESMAGEASMGANEPEKIKDLFFRRMDISYGEDVKPENVKLVRKDSGWVMTVDYEVRRQLVANLDVIGHFSAEKEFRRISE